MMGGIKMRKIRQFKIAEHVVLEVVAALGLYLMIIMAAKLGYDPYICLVALVIPGVLVGHASINLADQILAKRWYKRQLSRR